MRHLIAILLQNEAGALTRVTGLISTRGYNIESLSVAPTNDPTVSRVTLVTIGSDHVIAQINAQLQKLVDVVTVEDMTSGDHLARELLLIKLQLSADHIEAVEGLLRRRAARCCPRTRRAISSSSPARRSRSANLSPTSARSARSWRWCAAAYWASRGPIRGCTS